MLGIALLASAAPFFSPVVAEAPTMLVGGAAAMIASMTECEASNCARRFRSREAVR